MNKKSQMHQTVADDPNLQSLYDQAIVFWERGDKKGLENFMRQNLPQEIDKLPELLESMPSKSPIVSPKEERQLLREIEDSANDIYKKTPGTSQYRDERQLGLGLAKINYKKLIIQQAKKK